MAKPGYRYECQEAGYQGCFIEFDDVWTRRELREYRQLEGDPFLRFLAGKITGLRAVLADGTVLDQPEQLTETAIDGMDVELWSWLSEAILQVGRDIEARGAAIRVRTVEATAQVNAGNGAGV
jgi:hypothetical protein